MARRSSGNRQNGKRGNKNGFQASEPEAELVIEDTDLKAGIWGSASENDFRWKLGRIAVSENGKEYFPSSFPAETILDLPLVAYTLAVEFGDDEDVALSDQLRRELVELAETLEECFDFGEYSQAQAASFDATLSESN